MKVILDKSQRTEEGGFGDEKRKEIAIMVFVMCKQGWNIRIKSSICIHLT